MANITTGGTTASTFRQTFFFRNWRELLLLTITAIGVCAMAWYKIDVATDANAALVALVVFTELAAGVAVMAQALLRMEDKAAADKAFRFSIYARGALAATGLVLFLELATFAGAWPWVKPGPMSFTAFCVYEVGNGLMLLVEWMFANILQHTKKYDAAAEAQRMEQERDAARMERDAYKGQAEESDELLEVIRSLVAPHLLEEELRTAPIANQVAETLEGYALRVLSERERAEAAEGDTETLGLLSQMVHLVRKGAPQRIKEMVERHELAERVHPDALDALTEAARAQAMYQEFVGRAVTVRKNVQAFYCCECHERTEIGRGKPKVCKHCGTTQPAIQ